MKRIAVIQAKGGVGKTTTAVNTAHGLAMQGKKVLLVDCDTQNQVASFLGAASNADSTTSSFLSKRSSVGKFTQVRPDLWALFGGVSLVKLKTLMSRLPDKTAQEKRDKLNFVGKRFSFSDNVLLDYVIFDCAPGWDILTASILFSADLALCPATLEGPTIAGLAEFMTYVDGVIRTKGVQSFPLHILPTMVDRRVKKTDRLMEALKSKYGKILLKPIRYNVSLTEAAELGLSIFEYAPRSRGAADYDDLVQLLASKLPA